MFQSTGEVGRGGALEWSVDRGGWNIPRAGTGFSRIGEENGLGGEFSELMRAWCLSHGTKGLQSGSHQEL